MQRCFKFKCTKETIHCERMLSEMSPLSVYIYTPLSFYLSKSKCVCVCGSRPTLFTEQFPLFWPFHFTRRAQTTNKMRDELEKRFHFQPTTLLRTDSARKHTWTRNVNDVILPTLYANLFLVVPGCFQNKINPSNKILENQQKRENARGLVFHALYSRHLDI